MPYHALDDPDQLKALLDAFLAIESEVELSGVLRRVVDAARAITGARYGALGVLDEEGTRLVEFIHTGLPPGAEVAIGRRPSGEGILGLLVVDPRPLRLDNLRAHPDAVGVPPGHPELTTFLGVPVRVRDAVFGNLYLAEKAGGASFTEGDEALVVALATAAGIAVDHARLQARVADLSLAADRERIARDLHDTVIQRLFATGLSLQSSLSLVHEPGVRARIEEAVEDLDTTIRDVRATIFALEQPKAAGPTLRARVLTVCAEVSHGMGFEPDVRFRGAIDERVPEAVAVELLSSLREALSNVARHAGAGWVGVEVALDAGLSLVVTDDGAGLPPSSRPGGHGIANMRARARALGGRCSVRTRHAGGTEVRWSVPLDGGATGAT